MTGLRDMRPITGIRIVVRVYRDGRIVSSSQFRVGDNWRNVDTFVDDSWAGCLNRWRIGLVTEMHVRCQGDNPYAV